MRKMIVLLLALALIGTATIAPVAQAAKKKKSKKVDVTWYLRNEAPSDAEAPCDASYMQLKLDAGEDTTNCGIRVGGPLNEAFMAAGEDPVGYTYNAVEGLPVVLDVSKKITGKIIVMSQSAAGAAGLGAGPSTLNLTLSGLVNDKTTELGSFTSEYTVAPGDLDHEVEFELELDKKLKGKKLGSLALSMYQSGLGVNHSYYKVSESLITLPTLKKK